MPCDFVFKFKQVNCMWVLQAFLQCRKILPDLIKLKEVAKCLSLLNSVPFSKCLVQYLRYIGIQMWSNIF